MENMPGIGMGITESLALAAVFLWIVGVLACRRLFGLPAALVISTIKTAIPLLYFSILFNPEWLMKDDRVYHTNSVYLYDLGYGPIKILTDPHGFIDLKSVVGSTHVLYYWWILLSFHLFGKFYYSPVFLNVALTYISGAACSGIARLSGFSPTYRKMYVGFFLLHWDLLTWSSLFNLKDMIVLSLTTCAILAIMHLVTKLSVRSVIYLLIIFGLFSTIRYYLPVLICMAAGLWFVFQWKDKRKYLLLPLVAVVLLLLVKSSDQNLQYVKVGSPFAIIRFFMMPQFWSVEGEESFLFVSSLLHWIFTAPLLFGAYRLWYKSSLMRLPMIYAGIIIFFYSIVPELQGYRHRLQISWMISWCQFHALWIILQLGGTSGYQQDNFNYGAQTSPTDKPITPAS